MPTSRRAPAGPVVRETLLANSLRNGPLEVGEVEYSPPSFAETLADPNKQAAIQMMALPGVAGMAGKAGKYLQERRLNRLFDRDPFWKIFGRRKGD